LQILYVWITTQISTFLPIVLDDVTCISKIFASDKVEIKTVCVIIIEVEGTCWKIVFNRAWV
jgi:hypothetical protein